MGAWGSFLWVTRERRPCAPRTPASRPTARPTLTLDRPLPPLFLH
jgi:hypothetical protein